MHFEIELGDKQSISVCVSSVNLHLERLDLGSNALELGLTALETAHYLS